MYNKIFNGRFSTLYAFVIAYLIISFVIRSIFFVLSYQQIDFSFFNVLSILSLGFLYDLGAAIFFIFIYASYLLIIPSKIIGSVLDKIAIYSILSLTLFITIFSFLGEIPFWEEFNTRYNFIAVDYLIYTYEVVENINQSYPLPMLIALLLFLCLALLYIFTVTKRFQNTFTVKTSFKSRFLHFLGILFVFLFYIQCVTNKQAEVSDNTYNNELSKNGVFSFFAAYRSNELDFHTFYATLTEKEAFDTMRKELKQENQEFLSTENTIFLRDTKSDSIALKPTIILICLESFNADFMQSFGNTKGLTPNLDALASKSILFTDMYATGTRTVRGMEAITLSVPPTPGHSIVRRPGNSNLYSIASVLRQQKYDLSFFYGGDGYFDNMNSFFGGQGFDIVDRNRGNPLSDDIKTIRTNITDDEVTFENAWGICDEDIYTKVLQTADANYLAGKSTFSFVMTTSNHRPYTFPDGKIDMPQGSREAAVKYTDYALGDFIKKAQQKPWFKNTVFVVVADHCASSAGKWDITIDKHHIPAFIYNLPGIPAENISKLVSQIDIMPTVFGYLNWNYTTALYGKDICQMSKKEERALIGNYRTVGMLRNAVFTEINDRKQIHQYNWDSELKQMHKAKLSNKLFEDVTISYYQTASERYKNGLMKDRQAILR